MQKPVETFFLEAVISEWQKGQAVSSETLHAALTGAGYEVTGADMLRLFHHFQESNAIAGTEGFLARGAAEAHGNFVITGVSDELLDDTE